MTMFITWRSDQDAAFRAAYAETVGEMIQDAPPASEDGLTFTVGSSRVMDEHIVTLRAQGFDFDVRVEGSDDA